jgi:PAS domain S-box-containing protein
VTPPPENCPHEKLLKDGLEHVSEIEEKNLGGYFIVTASPIKDSNGNVLGSIHIAHDITKRKEMEVSLKKPLKKRTP